LLGFALLPLAFYAIIRLIEERSIKNIVLLGVATAVTVFSHNLTFMVFLVVMILWLLFALLSKAGGSKHAQNQLFAVGFCLGIIMLVEVLQLYTTGLPSYDFFNTAAFYKLRISFVDWVWAVKGGGLALFCVFVTAACLVAMYSTRRDPVRIMAIVCWTAAPLLMSQVYLLGLALDYRRAFFFSLQPSLIVIAAPLAFSATLLSGLRHVSIAEHGFSPWKFFRKAARSLPKVVLVLLSISFLVTQVGVGMTWPMIVNNWYNQIDPYGDTEKLQALEWIKYNTRTQDVFVADEAFGRWTEGYASRRVMMYVSPQYLFMKGEAERSTAAGTILESRFEIKNDLARIWYQAPYGNFTPLISFANEGVYEDVLYINDTGSGIYVSNGTYSWFESVSELAGNNYARSYSLAGGGASGRLTTDYVYGGISLREQVELDDRGVASLQYAVSTSESRLRVSNLTISLFAPEGSPFYKVYAEPSNTIRASTGPVAFRVVVTGETTTARLLESHGGNMMAVSFAPQSSSQSISATITVNKIDLPNVQGRSSEVLTVDRDDLIREFNVSYIVIPRLSEPEANGEIPLRPHSILPYDHLLADPAFEIAYENSKVIVLRVVSLGLT
jgi:hypothetical protein